MSKCVRLSFFLIGVVGGGKTSTWIRNTNHGKKNYIHINACYFVNLITGSFGPTKPKQT